jgi:histidine triad (HIT) family protein
VTHCLFCKIIAGRIPSKRVMEDEHVYAFHDINPQAPTHIQIIPRRHIASINDAVNTDEATLGHLFSVARTIARELHVDTDGYRLVVNTGPQAGQTVFHVHMHLLAGRNLTWPPG